MNNKVIMIAAVMALLLGGGMYFIVKNQSFDNTFVQSHRSYRLASDAGGKIFPVNTQREYSFSIEDERGSILKDFAITHTKPMHVIVVRKDLAYFQHLHPDFNPQTGVFYFSDLTFPADGQYRIFADFMPQGANSSITLFEDVTVGNLAGYNPQSLSFDARSKSFDSMDISLYTHGTPKSGVENMLMFSLSQNGQPVVDLQEYLGALGHSVILREDALDFIHAHPLTNAITKQHGMVDFMVVFPRPGKYRAFTQFQRDGKIVTTDFVIVVEQGNDTDGALDMNHGMH